MIRNPRIASTTPGSEKSPRATRVESSFLAIPAPCIPMNAIKIPIPAVIPYLRF